MATQFTVAKIILCQLTADVNIKQTEHQNRALYIHTNSYIAIVYLHTKIRYTHKTYCKVIVLQPDFSEGSSKSGLVTHK